MLPLHFGAVLPCCSLWLIGATADRIIACFPPVAACTTPWGTLRAVLKCRRKVSSGLISSSPLFTGWCPQQCGPNQVLQGNQGQCNSQYCFRSLLYTETLKLFWEVVFSFQGKVSGRLSSHKVCNLKGQFP